MNQVYRFSAIDHLLSISMAVATVMAAYALPVWVMLMA